jgi:hypothetical protein
MTIIARDGCEKSSFESSSPIHALEKFPMPITF